MDWLVNLAIILVVGYFILGLTRERKNSDNVLPRYTTQRSNADIEKESHEIIKRELSKDAPSYKKIKLNGFTGFLHYYLKFTGNDETLTTTAKIDTVQTLSKNDLSRD